MPLDINKWLERVNREGLRGYVEGYLWRKQVLTQDMHQTYGRTVNEYDQTLADVINSLYYNNPMLYKSLLEAVRQERAKRARDKKGNVAKRVIIKKTLHNKIRHAAKKADISLDEYIERLMEKETESLRYESQCLKELLKQRMDYRKELSHLKSSSYVSKKEAVYLKNNLDRKEDQLNHLLEIIKLLIYTVNSNDIEELQPFDESILSKTDFDKSLELLELTNHLDIKAPLEMLAEFYFNYSSKL